ncbi:Uncharacterized protein DAT39_008964, partial [Clarias magur]
SGTTNFTRPASRGGILTRGHYPSIIELKHAAGGTDAERKSVHLKSSTQGEA